MDGNGRWAQERGRSRLVGHRMGALAVRRTVRAAARKARVPAAIQVTVRIGDSSDHEWTDYWSSNIIDGRDEPLPSGYTVGPEDGIKQANNLVDEVGMVFRQVIFIPTYTNALGPRRSDL